MRMPLSGSISYMPARMMSFDDVVHGELLIEDLVVRGMALLVFVEIDGHAEMAGLAVPRDKRVAEQQVGVRDIVVVDVDLADVVLEVALLAGIARDAASHQQVVAGLPGKRLVVGQAELSALGLV
ncbi:hypothetical protein [Mitsuokella jalaludinii]|uniref:hypothetical protein n=1 Tax=Mitsuokella jalaludinii TaxID=187979 RepID=UPI00307A0084